MSEIKTTLESSNEAAIEKMMEQAQAQLAVKDAQEAAAKAGKTEEQVALPETKVEEKPVETVVPEVKLEVKAEEKPKIEGEEFSPEDLLGDPEVEADTEIENDKPVPFDKFKKRIDKVTAQREQAKRDLAERQREAEYWKAKALQAPVQVDPNTKPVTTTQNEEYSIAKDPNAPKLEQFSESANPIQDYVIALNDYSAKVKQALIQNQTRNIERQTKWQATMDTFAVDHPDFKTVFHNNLPVSFAMAESLKSSTKGAEIAYYLGKNPSVAARLANMNPVDAVLEMGRLEERFKGIKPKKVSSAPAPVAQVKGAPGVEPQNDPNKMTDAEFVAWRRKSGSSLVPKLTKRGEK